MKKLGVVSLLMSCFISISWSPFSYGQENPSYYLRNVSSANSPLELMRDIEALNDWSIRYRQETLANLSEQERFEKGKEIAETTGLEVVRTRNILLLHAHVLRLRQRIEQIENALESWNHPRLWIRQVDEWLLDQSRNRLVIIEQILASSEVRENGLLDEPITDLATFINKYSSGHPDRILIQTSQTSDQNRPSLRIKGSLATSSNNPYLPGILSSDIQRDPEMEQRWMDYIEAKGVREEIRRLEFNISRLSREEREFVGSIIGDFYSLERDLQIVQSLENEASLLEEALTAMYASDSISPYQFVKENTPYLENLFELDGSYFLLADIQRLMKVSENANLKQRLQALHVEFKKVASLIPHASETSSDLQMASCSDSSKWLEANIQERNPEAVQFLRTLNISSTGQTSSANDLSFLFLRPTLQGDSFSCTAHAMASDMEFEINRANQSRIDIDEEYAYLQLQGKSRDTYNWDNPISAQAKGQLSQGHWSDHGYPDGGTSGIPFRDLVWSDDGVLAEIKRGDHQGERQEVIDRLKVKPRYAVRTYASYHEGPYGLGLWVGNDGEWIRIQDWMKMDCSFIRLLIDNQQPPIVVLSSNARKLSGEDWLHIPPMTTRIGHVAVIVGYGQDIDPRDMVTKPYFILRDSFVDQPMHYKVAADELLPRIRELHKITEVVHLNPIPDEESFQW